MYRYAAYRPLRTRLNGRWPGLISGPRPYTAKKATSPEVSWSPVIRDRWTPAVNEESRETIARYGAFREGIGVRKIGTEKALTRYKAHREHIEEGNAKLAAATGRFVLIINNVSKALSEEDIMLLLPKGKHIEGWRGQGGLLKAIPGRDPNTCRRLGFWVLLFSSSGYASLFADRLRHTHSIATRHMPQTIDDPRAPIPGSQLDGEEDIPTILQEYTLLAPSQRLSIAHESEGSGFTFTPWLEKLLKKSQDWSDMEWNGKRVYPIRFCVDGAGDLFITREMLRQMISFDGQRRGLYWDIVLDDSGIVILNAMQQMTMRASEDAGGLEHRGAVNAPTHNWMICFLEEAEARRFVRRWHGKAPRFAVDDGIERHMVVDADCLF